MSDFFLGTGRLPPSLRSETDSAPAEENYSQSSRHASYDREDATDRHSRDDVRDGDWRSERFREISQGPCGCPSTWEATLDAHFENIALKILSVQGENPESGGGGRGADRPSGAIGMTQTSGNQKGGHGAILAFEPIFLPWERLPWWCIPDILCALGVTGPQE
jgi:hypothetical protein